MEDKPYLKILPGKNIAKRPFGRPRRRWEDNIKMDRKEIVVNRMNWGVLIRDESYRSVFGNVALNLWV